MDGRYCRRLGIHPFVDQSHPIGFEGETLLLLLLLLDKRHGRKYVPYGKPTTIECHRNWLSIHFWMIAVENEKKLTLIKYWLLLTLLKI